MKYALAAALRAYSGSSGAEDVLMATSGSSRRCDGRLTALVTQASPVQQQCV
jgi:hypothetical protein